MSFSPKQPVARACPSIAPLGFGFAIGLFATAAAADPCKAIPDRGPMPAEFAPGRRFEGPVVYVGDGDSLCVALARGRDRWVEVRLADVYAPELREPRGAKAKAILERVAMGRRLSCVAGRRSYDRAVATCRLDGRLLSERLRAEGAPEGGRGRPLANGQSLDWKIRPDPASR